MTSKKQLSEVDLTEIKGLSESFAAFVLENIPSGNMCFQTCYPLYLHLQNNCEQISLKLKNGTCEGRNHYWISLENSEETIIDPTITQFDFAKNMTSVYIGQKPCCFSEDPSFIFPYPPVPNAIIQSIPDKLLNNFSMNEKYEQDNIPKVGDFNLDNERKIILKAAVTINNQVDIKTHPDYFCSVKTLILKYTDSNQLSEF